MPISGKTNNTPKADGAPILCDPEKSTYINRSEIKSFIAINNSNKPDILFATIDLNAKKYCLSVSGMLVCLSF